MDLLRCGVEYKEAPVLSKVAWVDHMHVLLGFSLRLNWDLVVIVRAVVCKDKVIRMGDYVKTVLGESPNNGLYYSGKWH